MRIVVAVALILGLLITLAPSPADAAPTLVGPSGSVHGVVLDRAGNPVAAARVAIVGRTKGGKVLRRRTRTDRRGLFGFDRVPAGRYVVKAGKRGVGRDRERVLLRPGQHVRVKLVLH